MSPVHRAPMDPRDPAWDRDREMAASDPEPELRRRPPEPDDSGMVVVYVVGAALLVLILVAVLALAASRSGQTTDPVDVSGTSSAAQSGAPQSRGSGAPLTTHPTPEVS